MKIIKVLILIALVASLIFLIACEQKTNENASSGQNGNEVQLTVKGTSLSDILNKRAVIEYKAKYNVDSNFNGQENKNTMTWAIKGNDKMKWEVVNDNQTGSFYKLGDLFYICTMQEGKTNCIKMQQTQEQQINIEENLKSISDETKYSITPTASKTIAGAYAFCFDMTAKEKIAGFVSAEYCVSKEGVPLFMETTTDSGTTTMGAVEYSTTVADSEFVLPAEAQDITALTQKYNTGSAQ